MVQKNQKIPFLLHLTRDRIFFCLDAILPKSRRRKHRFFILIIGHKQQFPRSLVCFPFVLSATVLP